MRPELSLFRPRPPVLFGLGPSLGEPVIQLRGVVEDQEGLRRKIVQKAFQGRVEERLIEIDPREGNPLPDFFEDLPGIVSQGVIPRSFFLQFADRVVPEFGKKSTSFTGRTRAFSWSSSERWESGSNVRSDSMLSPKNSMRQGYGLAGEKTSKTYPRTANSPFWATTLTRV